MNSGSEPREVLPAAVRLPLERLDAVLFDLDVVLRDVAPDATPSPDTVELVERLRDLGLSTAVVVTHQRCREALRAGGLEELFTAVVDADDTRQPKRACPEPATLLLAAGTLGVHPARAAVVDATKAGVLAARAAGFGLVIGLDRDGGATAELSRHGADLVLTSLRAAAIDEDAARHRWWQTSRTTEASVGHAGWLLDYAGVDPDGEGIREALCTVGNGYLATRGAAPEADTGPGHYPGTYAAGVFNRLCTRVHGHVHEDESLVNLPNWLVLRWGVDQDRWVSPDGPVISEYRQSLDLRAGVLHRRYRYVDGDGRATTVVSTTLVSMAAPHLAAIQTTFVAENWSGTLHVCSALDGQVTNRQVAGYAPLAGRHLQPAGQGPDDPVGLWLRVRTSQSGIDVAFAARTRVLVPDAQADVQRQVDMTTGRPAETFTVPVCEGQPVRVEKTVACYTSRDRAVTEPATAARQAVARAASFDDLLTTHVHAWRRLWERSHVELRADGGTPALALNLHTYHLLTATSPNLVDLDAGVGARGLHGEGYRGHVFWDEVFVHRVLVLHLPEVSRALLLYRWRRLDAARIAAAAVGRPGAMFPWQSGSDGREETPTELFNTRSDQWMPDHSALQRHVGLAIAYSVWQYYQSTSDLDFLRTYGAELMVEIARFFADLAEEDPGTGRYGITGVMGPDEFHDGYPDADTPGLANNAYTNVMTVWLLHRVLEVVDLLGCHDGGNPADALSVATEELGRWRDITTRMYVPFHGRQIISQFDGYADLAEFDLPGYTARYGNIGRLDLILAAEGDSPNRYQIGKQADVLMLLYLLSAEELRDLLAGLGYRWPRQALRRTVEYYVERISHGSTLCRVVYAWVQARTDRAASWRFFTEALSADISDTQGGTTREGIHLGAMAGTLDLAERGYLGLETRHDALWLNPRLPQEMVSLHTLLTYRSHQLHLTVTRHDLTLAASPCNARPVTVRVAGHPPTTISSGQTITVPVK
ncbi:glycosyl hydrolase family 65 protein [Micromonospora halophytica]|uniref:glycosyl hydrolase family 65 protein n=1 Tax=Micromonospora halophytica TaxID=47864 RepID=UPI00147D6AB7|nr:glycosyl hydrolase family 65 protein [Micromonospora halophytica]